MALPPDFAMLTTRVIPVALPKKLAGAPLAVAVTVVVVPTRLSVTGLAVPSGATLPELAAGLPSPLLVTVNFVVEGTVATVKVPL